MTDKSEKNPQGFAQDGYRGGITVKAPNPPTSQQNQPAPNSQGENTSNAKE